jgi:hypothetical protein
LLPEDEKERMVFMNKLKEMKENKDYSKFYELLPKKQDNLKNLPFEDEKEKAVYMNTLREMCEKENNDTLSLHKQYIRVYMNSEDSFGNTVADKELEKTSPNESADHSSGNRSPNVVIENENEEF